MIFDRTTKTLLLAVVTFLLCGTVGACATTPNKQKPNIQAELPEAVKTATSSYIACLYASADSLAKTTAPAADVAAAAIGECGREYASYRYAVSDFFASAVSTQGETRARNQAEARSIEFREEVRGVLIARVLRARGVQ
jgi:predicted metal-binding protein